jgi:hypothetical protein
MLFLKNKHKEQWKMELIKHELGEVIGEVVQKEGHRGLNRIHAALFHSDNIGGEFFNSEEFNHYLDAQSSPRPFMYDLGNAKADYCERINNHNKEVAEKVEEKRAIGDTKYDNQIYSFRPIARHNKKQLRIVKKYMNQLVKKTNGCSIHEVELSSGIVATLIGRFTNEQRKNYSLDFKMVFNAGRPLKTNNRTKELFSMVFWQDTEYKEDIRFANAIDAYRYLIRFMFSDPVDDGREKPWITVFGFKNKDEAICDFAKWLRKQ